MRDEHKEPDRVEYEAPRLTFMGNLRDVLAASTRNLPCDGVMVSSSSVGTDPMDVCS
jgi:hypothetical protein